MIKFVYLFATATMAWANHFQPAEIRSGIIFANTRDVYLTSDEWTLIYYIDMEPFYEETDRLELLIDTLGQMCSRMKQNRDSKFYHCDSVMQHSEIHKNHMKNKIDLIKSFEHTRYKRAPVEIVGSIAKSLFGILDAESAKTYDNEINKLAKDSNYQFDVEASLNSQQKRDLETKKAIDSLQAQIKEREYLFEFEFNGLTDIVTLALLHHEEMTQTIIKLLSNVLHGKVTDIIPPKPLRETLKSIVPHLPPNTALPIDT